MSTVSHPRTTVKPARGACRLLLSIDGSLYAVVPMPCDPSAALRCHELHKLDATVYHVSRRPHGCECTCPDFVYRRDGIDPDGCKHIKALTMFGLLDAPAGPADRRPGEARAVPPAVPVEPEDDGSVTPGYGQPRPYAASDAAEWARTSNQGPRDANQLIEAVRRLELASEPHDHRGSFVGHPA
jgi:hypothetical protein